MTTWYVRPDTSHYGGMRDGKSYDAAWGGWSEVVWAGAGIVAGDTLYLCGAHSYAAQLNMGAHGATVSSRVTVRGDFESDPGSIVFSGSSFFLVNRNYTTYQSLTVSGGTSYCFYFYGAAITGITIRDCTLYGGGSSMINISGATGLSYLDITVDNNAFIGGAGAPFGSALTWFAAASGTPETSPITSLTRITISNNSFTGCSSSRSVIEFLIQDGANAATKMADIVVDKNTFSDCIGVAISINGPFVYGRNTGVRITDNIMSDMDVVGIIGGGIALGGFGTSLTSGFGSNIIARNQGYRLRGPTGMVNVFFGTYRIFHNYAEDLYTDTIDGAGILFDHGCDNCVAFGNTFKRLHGKPGIYYSGNGITILDATNIKVFGNVVEDAYCAIHLGNKDPAGQSSDIHNNTFLRCGMGVDLRTVANMTTNLVRNNIFTATQGVTSVRLDSGTWTGESGNCFHGFGSAQGHTLHASDETVDPELDSDYRPAAAALKGTGTYLGGRDYTGKVFYDPPNIGAVDAPPMAPRYALKQK